MQLVPNTAIFEAQQKKPANDMWANFLQQEANFALSLLRIIHSDFVAIAKLLKSNVAGDTALEAVCKSLSQNVIPAAYVSISKRIILI